MLASSTTSLLICCLLCLVSKSGTTSAPPPMSTQHSPIPSLVDVPDSKEGLVIAIGDLHGDLSPARALLLASQLVDEQGNWSGGSATLVQTGDVLDDGPDDLALVQYLQHLQQQAPRSGGRVVLLLGNHEVQNLRGDFSATHPSAVPHRAELLLPHAPIGSFLRSLPAAFIAGKFLFVHGGVSPSTLSLASRSWNTSSVGEWVDRMNTEVRAALSSSLPHAERRNVSAAALAVLDEDASAAVTSVRTTEAMSCRVLERDVLLSPLMLPVEHLVVGHVYRSLDGGLDCPGRWCWTQCSGHLLQIDFGMSRWKGGKLSHGAFLVINSATSAYDLFVLRGKHGVGRLVPHTQLSKMTLLLDAVVSFFVGDDHFAMAACALTFLFILGLALCLRKWCCCRHRDGLAGAVAQTDGLRSYGATGRSA